MSDLLKVQCVSSFCIAYVWSPRASAQSGLFDSFSAIHSTSGSAFTNQSASSESCPVTCVSLFFLLFIRRIDRHKYNTWNSLSCKASFLGCLNPSISSGQCIQMPTTFQTAPSAITLRSIFNPNEPIDLVWAAITQAPHWLISTVINSLPLPGALS